MNWPSGQNKVGRCFLHEASLAVFGNSSKHAKETHGCMCAVLKIFGVFDYKIWRALNEILSSHSIKHITSAIGIYFLLLYIQKRKLC